MGDSLVLYGHVISEPTRIVMAYCKLNGVPFEFRNVDIFAGEAQSPEYLSICPFGLIPSISQGTFNLNESIAIIHYISECYNISNHWLPLDPKERGKINAYCHWHHSNTRKIGDYVYYKRIVHKFLLDTINQAEVLELWEQSVQAVERIEAILETNTWIAETQEASIADIACYCQVKQFEIDRFNFSAYVRLERWMQRMEDFEDILIVHRELNSFADQINN